MEISIEMNLDQKTIARTGYTILDVLSDVGGIQSILISGFGILIGVWNYSNFENYLASRLYKIKNGTDDLIIQPPRLLNNFEFFIDMVPLKFRSRCCRKSRMMRGIEKARQ